ncbi:hypothetical protein [Vibrio mediterranei]|nr:hypothetical protein [Vibrio mediterranei]MCG9658658.1 hypothetical protein [Vibrio mediterranei]
MNKCNHRIVDAQDLIKFASSQGERMMTPARFSVVQIKKNGVLPPRSYAVTHKLASYFCANISMKVCSTAHTLEVRVRNRVSSNRVQLLATTNKIISKLRNKELIM